MSMTYWLGLVFFWLMLVIPTTYQTERGFLLAILLGGGIVYSVRNDVRIHASILFWLLVCVSASLLFMLNGAIKGGAGDLRLATVYVLWPLLYVFFMGILNSPNDLVPFLKVIVIGAITATAIGILLVLEGGGFFSLGLETILESQDAAANVREGLIEFRIFNLTTAVYAFPFLVAGLSLPLQNSPFRGAWRVLAWIGVFLTIIVLLVSGRRAFWVIAAISPIVAFIFMRVCGVRVSVISLIWKTLAFVMAIIAGILFFGLDIESMWMDFVWGFEFDNPENEAAYSRGEQFSALLRGWLENPFLGAGLGAIAGGIIRSVDQPWAYELTYLALLFHVGVLGVLVYGCAVVWLFLRSIQIARIHRDAPALVVPLLSGLTCFLLANATNPYLLKFDYLWTLFLPIAAVNAYLLHDDKRSPI